MYTNIRYNLASIEVLIHVFPRLSRSPDKIDPCSQFEALRKLPTKRKSRKEHNQIRVKIRLKQAQEHAAANLHM